MSKADVAAGATETHKHCAYCGYFKPAEEFRRAPKGLLGREAKCRECNNEYMKEWKRLNPKSKPTYSGMSLWQIKERATTTHKHCTQCGLFLPLDEFQPDKRSFMGRKAECRDCRRGYIREYIKRPEVKEATYKAQQKPGYRETQRRRSVLAWYGEQALPYEDRRLAGDPCDVCGSTEKVSIDHCHATSTVRGLLCRDCNLAVGRAHDDPDRLRALADYLERSAALTSSSA